MIFEVNGCLPKVTDLGICNGGEWEIPLVSGVFAGHNSIPIRTQTVNLHDMTDEHLQFKIFFRYSPRSFGQRNRSLARVHKRIRWYGDAIVAKIERQGGIVDVGPGDRIRAKMAMRGCVTGHIL